jgi:hypothetical protein
MNGDFLGGGVILAIAAVLWLVYLVPTLWRRHNFDATERNAVRLNQTIRALVETSETPHELRVEATARAVAQQQRVLRKAEAEARHQLRAATLRTLSPEVQAARVLQLRKRDRRTASLLLFGSLAVVAWGTFTLVTNGQWGFMAGGGVGVIAATMILRNVAPGRGREAVAVRAEAKPARRNIPASQAQRDTGWVPASTPAPMTARAGSLARSTVDAQRAREQRLRNAAIDAAVAAQTQARPTVARPATAVAPVVPAAVASTPAVAPRTPAVARERLASMGLVGDTGDVELDLTEVLRRRRTGS